MVETPHAHPFGGFRIPPGILAAAKPPPEFARIKYTESQIAEALISIASGILHTQLNRSQALNCAGALSVYVNDPRNTNFVSGGNLEANPAFSSLVAEKAPLLAMAVDNPEAAKAKAQAELAQHNASAGPLSPAAEAMAGRTRFAQMERGGASGGNSARFDAMDSASGSSISSHASAYWGTAAGMNEMRGFAVQHGVPWVANNPEILKLGPAAIQTFADVHLRQESYQKITQEAHFTARQAVTLAEFAKKTGQDGNTLFGTITEGVKGIAGDNVPLAHKIDSAVTNYAKKVGTPEEETAKGQLFETLKPHAADPAKRPAVDKILDGMKIRKEEFDAAVKSTAAKEAKAEIKGATAETKVTSDKAATTAADTVFGEASKEPAAPERPSSAPKDKVDKAPAGPAPGK